MNIRKFILSLTIGIICVLMNGCGPSISGPSIVSITHIPDLPREGEDVVFTIAYQNTNETETFNSILLEVSYDPDLIYKESAPGPDQNNPSQHKLTWSIESLKPSDGGEIKINFVVNNGFPLDKYELNVDAKISSTSSQGTPVAKSSSGSTHVEGHFTPTPIPSNTDTPAKASPVSEQTSLIKNFEAEGVTVELPWQGQQLEIRQEDFDTSLLQAPVQDGYEIIRPVIYLKVVNLEGQEIFNFDPPMIVTVTFTDQDIEKSGDPEKLILLIYDTNQNLWIPYDTRIDPSAMTGTTSISSWTSHICWGR